jgi:hypothetical protein
MTNYELKEALLSKINNELVKYNFKLKKSLNEFTEINKDGWHKFQLIFLVRENGWEINLGMLIRKNMVEDIYHKASYFEPKYHKTTPTIGITVENYINDGSECRFDLTEEKDIEICFTGIIKLFKKIALPFFDKYEDIEAIEKAINVKEGDSIFSGIKYEGNMGIILAKLVNNPDYNFFKQKYLKYYSENYDGFYLEEFENILKILEKN